MTPMQIRNLRLNRARTADAERLARTLARISEPFNAHIGLAADGSLGLRAG